MSTTTRPSWNEYFLGIARAVAERSDCERSKVGAVVVKDRRVRSTGYNGAPAGKPGCLSCPRRVSDAVPLDGAYDTDGPGRCVAVHAEVNAILYCERADLPGSTLYITREPCAPCSKLIEAVGITDVVYPGESIDGLFGNYSLTGLHGYLETVVVPKPPVTYFDGKRGYTLDDLQEWKLEKMIRRGSLLWSLLVDTEDHIIRGEN